MLTKLRGVLGKRFELNLDAVNEDYGGLAQDSHRSLSHTDRSESSEIWLAGTPRTEGDVSDDESPRYMSDFRMTQADLLFDVCSQSCSATIITCTVLGLSECLVYRYALCSLYQTADRARSITLLTVLALLECSVVHSL